MWLKGMKVKTNECPRILTVDGGFQISEIEYVGKMLRRMRIRVGKYSVPASRLENVRKATL